MDKVMQRISGHVMKSISMDKDIEDAELYSCIDEALITESRKNMIPISERERYRKMIFNSMKRLDILQDLLEDASISEIMINGYKDIYIEKNGSISRCGKEFETQGKLEDLAQKIAGLSNRIVNESKPIVDTRLADGSRVNIVLSPAAIDGPVITVRKFYDRHLTMQMLTEMGSLTEEAAFMLKKLVSARYNIFVSGGTGSGKTTFLNALSDFIPEDERIITIEDSAELKLNSIKNLVRLEARNENVEGTNAITIRDLIKTSLRMRPDRIIVGEVRGEEALDMLNAMNTGHDGSLSTGHSNSPKDMLSRIETMVLMGMDMPIPAIRGLVSSAIDIIVHLGRLRDKTRRVLQIIEVLEVSEGNIKINTLYEFRDDGEDVNKRVKGELVKKNELENIYKMKAAGITYEI